MKIITPLALILIINIVSFQATAETKVHFSTGFTPPVSTFFNTVLRKMDQRLQDISISFEALPAERSLSLSDQGINDGECCRIPMAIKARYKNLIPINESFMSVRFSAFEKKHHTAIKSFSDLKPYTVGTVKGWKLAVKKLEEFKPVETHIVTTPDQLFKMLDQGRIDYGVMGYLSGLKSISKLKLKNIKAISPPLAQKPLYLMLNKKHKNLIPAFNKVVADMKKDGTIQRLYNELLKTLN